MARVSLYVPDGLKAEMDAVDGVNWSEIARPAFVAAVAEYQHRREGTMQTAIERLRASKMKYELDQRAWGKEEGRQVAKDLLVYEQLSEIEKISTESLDRMDALGAYQALKSALDPEGEDTEAEFNDMYFTNDDQSVGDLFALGFIEGAQEFYNEVKDQI